MRGASNATTLLGIANAARAARRDLGQYEVSYIHVGESNYRRQYRIFTTNSDNVYRRAPAPARIAKRRVHGASRGRQDYTSEIFFKTPPDIAGNVCSPVATVFQSASFISALEELALQAEVVRARQMLVTQPAVRQQGNQTLAPANLFFDSESRAVQASASADDDAAQAQSLAMQAKMMNIINRLQTTDASGRERPGVSGAPATHIPPPIPPQLFAAPGKTARRTDRRLPVHVRPLLRADRQQVVPGVRPPEARGDLVDLMRVVRARLESCFGAR